MPTVKLQINPTYSFGGYVVWKYSKWLTWQPSWISEWNDYSNSKFPCGSNASRQVWVQSDLGFGSRCCFKIFKMPAQATILDSRTEKFSNSESLCRSNATDQVSAQSNLWFGRRCHMKNFKMAAMATILDIRTERFSNSESLCCSDASHRVSA